MTSCGHKEKEADGTSCGNAAAAANAVTSSVAARVRKKKREDDKWQCIPSEEVPKAVKKKVAEDLHEDELMHPCPPSGRNTTWAVEVDVRDIASSPAGSSPPTGRTDDDCKTTNAALLSDSQRIRKRKRYRYRVFDDDDENLMVFEVVACLSSDEEE